MPNKIFVGIDTSNYTTSFAFCDTKGHILKNYKILLPVKEGEKGLRQSDAVFAHIRNLPLIAEKIRKDLFNYEIISIGYSAYPRDCQGSYMPCFLVGEALATMLASVNKLNPYKISHQAGHVQAALYSAGVSFEKDFIAFHVSGGTTEILHIINTPSYFDIELIGESVDLHAGQAIDRIGVMLGLTFPCGSKLGLLCADNKKEVPKYHISVNNFNCNLSGLENLAKKLYLETNDKPLVASFTIDFIGKTIEKITENLRNKYPNTPIIYAGGVMSNKIIQNRLSNKFEQVYFSEPEFSSDNAAGVALLTRKKYLNKEEM